MEQQHCCISGLVCIFINVTCRRACCTPPAEEMLPCFIASIITIVVAPEGCYSSSDQDKNGQCLFSGLEMNPYNSKVLHIWNNFPRNSRDASTLDFACKCQRRPLLSEAKEKSENASPTNVVPISAESWCLWVLRVSMQGIYYSAITINRCLWNPGTRVSWTGGRKSREESCERQRSSQAQAINHRPPLFPEDSFIVP